MQGLDITTSSPSAPEVLLAWPVMPRVGGQQPQLPVPRRQATRRHHGAAAQEAGVVEAPAHLHVCGTIPCVSKHDDAQGRGYRWPTWHCHCLPARLKGTWGSNAHSSRLLHCPR